MTIKDVKVLFFPFYCIHGCSVLWCFLTILLYPCITDGILHDGSVFLRSASSTGMCFLEPHCIKQSLHVPYTIFLNLRSLVLCRTLWVFVFKLLFSLFVTNMNVFHFASDVIFVLFMMPFLSSIYHFSLSLMIWLK